MFEPIVLIIAFVLLLVVCLSFKFVNKVFVFILIWYSFWCFISCTEICDYVVEYNYGRVFILSNVFILVFSAIIVVMIRRNNDTFGNKSFAISSSTTLIKNFRVSIAINLVRVMTLALNIYLLLGTFMKIVSGQLTIFTLRTAAFSGGDDALFSSITNILFYIFAKAFIIFDLIMEMSYVFVYGKKKINVIVILNAVLYCSVFLDRIDLFRTVLITIIILFCSNISIASAIKKHKMIKRALPVFVLFALGIVIVRYIINGTGTSIVYSVVKTVLTDFSASYVTFDRFFVEYLNGKRLVDCSIFEILFNGFIKVLQPLISEAGTKVVNFNGILAERFAYAIDIGRNRTLMFNAFYTMYSNILSGGDLFQTYMVSVFLGTILGSFYKKWQKTKSVSFLGLFVFFSHLVIMGLLRWEMGYYWCWVVLFLFLLPKEYRVYAMPNRTTFQKPSFLVDEVAK